MSQHDPSMAMILLEMTTDATPKIGAHSNTGLRSASPVLSTALPAPSQGDAVPRVIDFRYREYISSDEWREKRQERLELDAHMCSNCDATTRLEVHHLTYDRMGNERMEDLQTLCHDCHGRLHGTQGTVLPISGSVRPRRAKAIRQKTAYERFLASAETLHKAALDFRQATLQTHYSSRYEGPLNVMQMVAEEIVDNTIDDMKRWQLLEGEWAA